MRSAERRGRHGSHVGEWRVGACSLPSVGRCPLGAPVAWLVRGVKDRAFLFCFPLSRTTNSLLHLRSRNREQALSFSLTPKALCSIQVRDQALVIDLERFKRISSLSSPPSFVLIWERIEGNPSVCFWGYIFGGTRWFLWLWIFYYSLWLLSPRRLVICWLVTRFGDCVRP
jgi:hypothetical protein